MDDSSNIQEILSRSDSIGVNEVSFCCQNFLSRFANMQMKLSTGFDSPVQSPAHPNCWGLFLAPAQFGIPWSVIPL